MKKIIYLLLIVLTGRQAISQNIGIGVPVPMEKLDVNGAIKMGTSSGNNAGSIRYGAGKFEGNNGLAWDHLHNCPLAHW